MRAPVNMLVEPVALWVTTVTFWPVPVGMTRRSNNSSFYAAFWKVAWRRLGCPKVSHHKINLLAAELNLVPRRESCTSNATTVRRQRVLCIHPAGLVYSASSRKWAAARTRLSIDTVLCILILWHWLRCEMSEPRRPWRSMREVAAKMLRRCVVGNRLS